MKQRVGILAAVIALAVMLTVVATSDTSVAHAVPLSQSTSLLQGDVDALNVILYKPYATWVADYATLRKRSEYQWMDWSQDGCSIPGVVTLGYNTTFHEGCLRHDMMWRTLAVADRGTGRVWNERNRYRADRQFLRDHEANCAQRWPAGQAETANSCAVAAGAYFGGIRVAPGQRWFDLEDSERTSVDTTTDAGYHRGYKLMPAAPASTRCTGANRCIAINYVEHNGNPFSPQNLGSIPTGTVIEIQVVRANQQSKDGAPRIDAPNRLGASHPYKKTGAIEIEATYPFIIGTSRSLDCANSGSHRTVDADARVYPVSRPDNELKRSTFYMKACRTVSASELDDAKLELRPIKASRQYRGYEYTNGIRVRHYQNMNAQTATASFHARPDEMTISREDTWYGPITLHTTSGSTSSVRVVANPNDDTPLVEIGSSTITANNCRNGAERNDSRTVRTGGAIKIAMCGAGTGTLELRHPTTGDLINSYIVALSGSTSVVPAPAPVITPTCSTTSLASASGSRSGRWSASDCTSPYRTNKYVDYYRMTAGSSQEMRIDLTSSEDAYLLFYNGTSTTGAPDAFNDDYGGETDARLTVDLVGGRTYTIGATTYSDRTTGSYSLRLTPVTIAVVVPAPGTPNRPSVTAGNARVSLDWSNVANATGYEVQQWDSVARVWRALPSGGATVSFNGSSATVRGLTNGVSYYHRVRATNSAHQSGWSSYSTAKPTVTLTVPSNLEGTGYSSGRIALDWSNVSNAAEYEVQQWDGRAQLWRTLPFTEQGFSSEYRISFSGSSANIYNLSSGVSYSHRVRAMNGLIVTTWTSFITTSVP